MRIDRLILRNYKRYDLRSFEFHPNFNLIVGANGTGKTSTLDALSIAISGWLLGINIPEKRNIRHSEVLLGEFEYDDEDEEGKIHHSMRWEYVYPCEISAKGLVQDHEILWTRSLNSYSGRTTSSAAKEIKELATRADQAVRSGKDVILPLISYYGTGRLWQEPRDSYRALNPDKVTSKEEQSRLAGYRNSVDPRLSVAQFSRWVALQSWIAFQNNARETPIFKSVKQAILECVEGARYFEFNPKFGEVIIGFDDGARPFSLLSDGQRCMLAMVGDIAQKAAKLNPHLGGKALALTPGVVLIDEIDLHLHPRWQQHVVEDLRRTFPNIQFICTTHSPFIIQSLRSGEELISLDGNVTAEVGNLSIEQIALGIQQVSNTKSSARYTEMLNAAKKYLLTLDEARGKPEDQLADYKQKLASGIAPYADNPAFQAFLEMQRAAVLGE
ncbi:AAA family ATPase [Pseudomonas panipatensis]|uniref:AAA family ATPase n=1 Tax=Pseudomonas panipatensis TaxID=428992 RepID=UPI0035B30C01